MKRLILFLLVLFLVIPLFSQQANGKFMTVTAKSDAALSAYNKAKKYFDDVHIDKALENFKKALTLDPGFFMVNYQLALYSLLNQEEEDFHRFAKTAIDSKSKLSDAEEILKEALVRLDGGSTDVTDAGRKLVSMYPGDPESYNNLVSFQSLARDSAGMVETLEKAVKIASSPAPFYNQLGYVYLTMKQMDKAEAAFEKYIELDPNNPNAYDSKGDFYLYNKQYEKAYYLYLKANRMDPAFSQKKADLARKLYEESEGREMNVISI